MVSPHCGRGMLEGLVEKESEDRKSKKKEESRWRGEEMLNLLNERTLNICICIIRKVSEKGGRGILIGEGMLQITLWGHVTLLTWENLIFIFACYFIRREP